MYRLSRYGKHGENDLALYVARVLLQLFLQCKNTCGGMQ